MKGVRNAEREKTRMSPVELIGISGIMGFLIS